MNSAGNMTNADQAAAQTFLANMEAHGTRLDQHDAILNSLVVNSNVLIKQMSELMGQFSALSAMPSPSSGTPSKSPDIVQICTFFLLQ